MRPQLFEPLVANSPHGGCPHFVLRSAVPAPSMFGVCGLWWCTLLAWLCGSLCTVGSPFLSARCTWDHATPASSSKQPCTTAARRVLVRAWLAATMIDFPFLLV